MDLGHEGIAGALSASRFARERASGLRRWSRPARRCVVIDRTQQATGPGPVRTSTLAGILSTEHGLGAREAASALELALLVAGYESHSVVVAGADALDIIDTASPGVISGTGS